MALDLVDQSQALAFRVTPLLLMDCLPQVVDTEAVATHQAQVKLVAQVGLEAAQVDMALLALEPQDKEIMAVVAQALPQVDRVVEALVQ